MVKLENYPCESSSFKGIRGIVFRWSMQLLPESEELKEIIKKFMTCFFDDKLVMKTLGREDVFETPGLCRFVKRAIGTQILNHMSQRQ